MRADLREELRAFIELRARWRLLFGSWTMDDNWARNERCHSQ
jgi:hypothetical protein